jgi:hypothetical protein
MPRVPVPGRRKNMCGHQDREKGSDVNLATHLLHDARMGRFEVAAVVTTIVSLENRAAAFSRLHIALRIQLSSSIRSAATKPSGWSSMTWCLASGTSTTGARGPIRDDM